MKLYNLEKFNKHVHVALLITIYNVLTDKTKFNDNTYCHYVGVHIIFTIKTEKICVLFFVLDLLTTSPSEIVFFLPFLSLFIICPLSPFLGSFMIVLSDLCSILQVLQVQSAWQPLPVQFLCDQFLSCSTSF